MHPRHLPTKVIRSPLFSFQRTSQNNKRECPFYCYYENTSDSICEQGSTRNVWINSSLMTGKSIMCLPKAVTLFFFLCMALPTMGKSGVRKQRAKIASLASTMETIRDSSTNQRKLHKLHKLLPRKKKKKKGKWYCCISYCRVMTLFHYWHHHRTDISYSLFFYSRG